MNLDSREIQETTHESNSPVDRRGRRSASWLVAEDQILRCIDQSTWTFGFTQVTKSIAATDAARHPGRRSSLLFQKAGQSLVVDPMVVLAIARL
jgi:hypothetical protein